MDRDFLSEFLDLNGDGHVTPEEARIGLSFLETALHREPELWDEDGLPLTQVRKPQMRFRMQLPQSVPPLSILRRQADLTP